MNDPQITPEKRKRRTAETRKQHAKIMSLLKPMGFRQVGNKATLGDGRSELDLDDTGIANLTSGAIIKILLVRSFCEGAEHARQTIRDSIGVFR